MNGYNGGRIEAIAQSLILQLAKDSANIIRVTQGVDALKVAQNLTIGKNSTDTVSGSLTINVDNFVSSPQSNGIDVGGNLTIENVSALSVEMSAANVGIAVGGNMTLTNNGTVTVTVAQTAGTNGDGFTVVGNVTISGTGTYINNSGFYVAGAVTRDLSSTATINTLGKNVDYLISTWAQLAAAFNSTTGVNSAARKGTETTLMFVGALSGSTVTHNITITSSLSLNNAGTGAPTVLNIFSCGNTRLVRGASLTSSSLFVVGSSTTVNQKNQMVFGASGGMGSSTLTLDGSAVWTSATSGRAASATLTSTSGVTTLATKAGIVDTASGGVRSTASLIYDSGTLAIYAGVTLQNNANSVSYNGSSVSRNQSGGVFVRGTGTGSSSNPNASGNAIFTLDGGTISNCSGQYGGGVEIFGTFYFRSGQILNCAANIIVNEYANEGGGVFNHCNFIMSGGTISGCIACGDYYNGSTVSSQTDVYGKGGAFHNSKNSMAQISGGRITANTSGWAGGGIYDGGLGSATLSVTGGTIDHNLASIGGGIYLNATVKFHGGEITHNTVASNHNPHNQAVTPINYYGYGNGVYIEYRSSTATVYPMLVVGGSVAINTNNNVYVATISSGTNYFQPIVIDAELTVAGPTMLVQFGFVPTEAEIAAHKTLFARYTSSSIPVDESKFLIGCGANLTNDYTAKYYATGGVNYLEINLASNYFQARVNQYYFVTVGDAITYVNTNFANGTAVTLYIADNSILPAAQSLLSGVDLTIASETSVSQSAALATYGNFIDYSTGQATETQTTHGDFTVIWSSNIAIAAGQEAIINVEAGAKLTLGDGVGRIFFDGNYAYPVTVSGFYVEGAAGTAAAGELTIEDKAVILNLTNKSTTGTNLAGALCVAGNLTMNGGVVTSSVGYAAGGIRVFDGGSFTMNGGSINANLGGAAGTWGEPSVYTGAGGVAVESGGSFVISTGADSAVIADNQGLYGAVKNNGTFTMHAGVIRNNSSTASGIQVNGVYQNGTMYLGFTALILSTETRVNGVYLTSGKQIIVDALWTGGNTSSAPLYVNSAETASSTVLVQTTFNGSTDRNLDGLTNTIDSAYDLLLSGAIVHYQGLWIVQGTDAAAPNTGKITDDELTNTLVIGKAVIAYNANAPSGATVSGSTVDPLGSTGYNGNTVVTLEPCGYTISDPTLNYQFIAWNTRADGSGLWYYPFGTVGDQLTTVANVTLYAIWSATNVFVVNTLLDNTTADSYTSLREAIVSANSAAVENNKPIYIRFETMLNHWEQSWDDVSTGVITLASSLPALNNSIVISTAEFYTTTGKSIAVDGAGAFRIFTVTAGTTLLPVWISGLTLQNGGGLDTTNGESSGHGGAVYIGADSVTNIDGVTFSNNSAALTTNAKASGGSIFNRGTANVTNVVITQTAGTSAGYENAYLGGAIYNVGTFSLSGQTVEYCGATGSGGAVYNAGTFTVSDCDFTSNRAQKNGGAIQSISTSTALGSLTLSACRLTNNSSTLSGGGICNFGTASLTHLTATGNSAAQNGGGICNAYYTLAGVGTSEMTITDSTLTQNSAVYGGGIINGSVMTIAGCTISGNTASENGGGVSNTNGIQENASSTSNASLTITNSATGTASLFENNQAIYGAAVGHWGTKLEILGTTVLSSNGSATTVHGGGLFAYLGNTVTLGSNVSMTDNLPENSYYVVGEPTLLTALTAAQSSTQNAALAKIAADAAIRELTENNESLTDEAPEMIFPESNRPTRESSNRFQRKNLAEIERGRNGSSLSPKNNDLSNVISDRYPKDAYYPLLHAGYSGRSMSRKIVSSKRFSANAANDSAEWLSFGSSNLLATRSMPVGRGE